MIVNFFENYFVILSMHGEIFYRHGSTSNYWMRFFNLKIKPERVCKKIYVARDCFAMEE